MAVCPEVDLTGISVSMSTINFLTWNEKCLFPCNDGNFLLALNYIFNYISISKKSIKICLFIVR